MSFSNSLLNFWQLDNQLYYEVDERVKDWVMGSAAKKWRDFNSDLKALYFHEEKTDEELLADCDARVHEDDWKWLIDHWRTDAAKVCCKIIVQCSFLKRSNY